MPKPKPLPDYETLHELLELRDDYTLWFLPKGPEHFEDGKNFPKEYLCEIWNNQYAFTQAFNTLNNAGYYQGRILSEIYLAHRIIWKMVYGKEPDNIDHIDGNPLNNHISNMINVRHNKNMKNRKLHKTNVSGYHGIRPTKNAFKPWKATIAIKGKEINLGTYTTLEEAVIVRKEAERKYGFHENHGNR